MQPLWIVVVIASLQSESILFITHAKTLRKTYYNYCTYCDLDGLCRLSAGNLFSHYTQQNTIVYQSVKSGQYEKAQAALPQDVVAGDILDNFERGRVDFLNADYPESKSALEVSDKAVRVQQDKALISISDTATSLVL